MAYAEADTIDVKKIPVIDITTLRNGSASVSVAKQLHEASTGLGFIYIKGHGIPQDVIRTLRNDALKFFRMPRVFRMLQSALRIFRILRIPQSV